MWRTSRSKLAFGGRAGKNIPRAPKSAESEETATHKGAVTCDGAALAFKERPLEACWTVLIYTNVRETGFAFDYVSDSSACSFLGGGREEKSLQSWNEIWSLSFFPGKHRPNLPAMLAGSQSCKIMKKTFSLGLCAYFSNIPCKCN